MAFTSYLIMSRDAACSERLRSILLLGALLVGGTGASAAIVGKDNRKALSSEQRRMFSGVGQVICEDRGRSVTTTMTLVQNHFTIVGAGHYRQRASDLTLMPVDACRFELYDGKGVRLFVSSFIEVAAAVPSEPAVAMRDWAVLRLDNKAPPWAQVLQLRPVSVEEMAAMPNVFAIAFHRRRAGSSRNVAKISSSCHPRKVSYHPFVFLHDCDTLAGSSGSLVFSETAPSVGLGMINGYSHRFDANYGHTISPELIDVLRGSLP